MPDRKLKELTREGGVRDREDNYIGVDPRVYKGPTIEPEEVYENEDYFRQRTFLEDARQKAFEKLLAKKLWETWDTRRRGGQ